MNRPEKRNAMSPDLHFEMDDALQRIEVDENVKVVVVTGAGGNFSAGQYLQKFFRELENKPLERKRAADAANRWRWERLYNYDKPTPRPPPLLFRAQWTSGFPTRSRS